MIGHFIGQTIDKLENEETDNDSVIMFHLEGENSNAGSLSSLSELSYLSDSDEAPHNFAYLVDFGPKFESLADLYAEQDDNYSVPY